MRIDTGIIMHTCTEVYLRMWAFIYVVDKYARDFYMENASWLEPILHVIVSCLCYAVIKTRLLTNHTKL